MHTWITEKKTPAGVTIRGQEVEENDPILGKIWRKKARNKVMVPKTFEDKGDEGKTMSFLVIPSGLQDWDFASHLFTKYL